MPSYISKREGDTWGYFATGSATNSYTIIYSSSGVTATSGLDFESMTASVTGPQNGTAYSPRFQIYNDDIYERNETFYVSATGSDGRNFDALYTITDEEDKPLIDAITQLSINETDTNVFQRIYFNLDHAASFNYNISVSNSTNSYGVSLQNSTVVINQLTKQGFFDIKIVGDDIYTGHSDFTINLNSEFDSHRIVLKIAEDELATALSVTNLAGLTLDATRDAVDAYTRVNTSFDITNIRFGIIDNFYSGTIPESIISNVDMTAGRLGYVTTGISVVTSTIQALEAYQSNGSLAGLSVAGRELVVGVLSGSAGEIVGAGAATLTTFFIGGSLAPVAVGFAAGFATAYAVDWGLRAGYDYAAGQIAPLRSNSSQPISLSSSPTDFGPYHIGQAPPTPAWRYNYETGEFTWLTALDPGRSSLLRTQLGFDNNPLTINGDIDADKADVIFGGGGNDTINGLTADDAIYAGAGNDAVAGGIGVDLVFGDGGDDTISGGDGNDYLDGGAGGDTLNGGTGWDTSSYANATSSVQVVMYNTAYNTGEATGDTFTGIEALQGSTNIDILVGDFAVNAILGGAGGDWIDGTYGGDYLYGEAGNDSLVSRQQADVLDGGTDFDYARYDYADAGLRVYIYDTTQNSGWAAGDTFVSIEGLAGSYFADDLRGDASQNIIYGLGGADYIIGLGGSDLLIGGAGQDLFHFVGIGDGGAGGDAIQDFVSGQDRISVTGAFFGLGSPGGVAIDSFRFVSGAAANLATSQFIYNGATRQLFYDIDGTGAGAQVLLATLQVGATMAAGDIIVI
jgi:Ca2+-binding RTX toxin-like protein